MRPIRTLFASSPVWPRVAPFAVFLALTSFQDAAWAGPHGRFWLYALKTVFGAWALWAMRPFVAEMQWRFSIPAVAAGAAGFLLWVGLEGLYPPLPFRGGGGWNPAETFSHAPALGWFFVVVRLAGVTLVVPPLEEVFYRSFLYRWIVKPEFEAVELRRRDVRAFLLTAGVFGAVHAEWLPGILCGALFQWLVLRRNRLGDAMTAHAVTNLLLGLWVVWRGAWQFW